MNYRYKISGEDIIVTEEEHNRIQDARSKGATQLSLRNGTLGLNLAYFQFYTETERPTAVVEKQLALLDQNIKQEDELSKQAMAAKRALFAKYRPTFKTND